MEYNYDIVHHLEGEELCLHCLAASAPTANSCNGCGAPKGFFATALPYQQIFAEGFLYREAIHAPRSLLTVIGIWVIFGTHMMMGYISFQVLNYVSSMPKSIEDFLHLMIYSFPALMFLVGLAGVFMVTKNYVMQIRKK